MIGLLIDFFKTSVLCILLNDFMKRNYPDKYNDFLISTSFELIHLYSKGQIFFNKFILQVNALIESNAQIKKILSEKIKYNEIYKINDNIIIRIFFHILYYLYKNYL